MMDMDMPALCLVVPWMERIVANLIYAFENNFYRMINDDMRLIWTVKEF